MLQTLAVKDYRSLRDLVIPRGPLELQDCSTLTLEKALGETRIQDRDDLD